MSPICSDKHKIRLFVGEGNFSFTEAFIKKHDEKFGHNAATSIAHSIIATDLVKKIHCNRCNRMYSSDGPVTSTSGLINTQNGCDDDCVISRIVRLTKIGVRIILVVDATSLSTHPKLKGKRISRIHWNCPHDGKAYTEQTLPEIIYKFFAQCYKMQSTYDRIHITLAQPTEGNKNAFYQGYCYDISRGPRVTGYTLVKKRKFGRGRYPGYQHTKTNSHEAASVTDKGMREFVFEYVDRKQWRQIVEKAQVKNDPNKHRSYKLLKGLRKISNKECAIKQTGSYWIVCQYETRFYYACSSDEDSSDGEL
ncbi:MAG: Rossmann-like fold-containing protein [Parachlamydiaceae bacterium]